MPFLESHPEIRHEWHRAKSFWDGGQTILICARSQPNEVFASLRSWQITVGSNGSDQDFEDWGRKMTGDEVAREAFDFFVELLRKNGHLSPQATGVA